MNLQDEAWTAIPDLDGYEVSTSGRVRSWTSTNGKAHPYIHEGRQSSGDVYYDLAGSTYSIDELMRWTYDVDVEDFELGHMPGERDRELTQYEVSEIVLLEGLKPAFEVAEEFRIDSNRVRGIWDGTER